MDIFESPKILLKETKSHIIEIDLLIQEFFSDCILTRFVDVDPVTGHIIHKARLNKFEVPDRVRYLASGSINDLRHCLDQVACCAIKALTGVDAGHVYFPIANNLSDLNGRLSKDFPESVHETFRIIAPYPIGNPIICSVAKAAKKKHTNICKVGGNISHVNFTGSMSVVLYKGLTWDYSKNEIFIGITEPNGFIDCDFNITAQIIFDGTEAIDREPIVPFLWGAHEAVTRAVSSIERTVIRTLS